ncbi:MAG TPA: EamA family transporter [Chloroflexia bacterium]|nr:EamA family transporter [Chloroflexia bacterium]
MDNRTGRCRGVLLVLLAGALWGTLGTLYTWVRQEFGLGPVSIVFWRAALAALALGLVLGGIMPLAGRGAGLLKVKRADLPLFVAFGLLGVTAFFLLYIYAVVLTGVAVAVVLLYTSPVFVALMAWRFLGENFSISKVAALLLTLAGCTLVARVFDQSQAADLVGIACGLGAAFTYALYSILGKISLRRGYPIATMSLYVFGIGAVGLLVVALIQDPGQLVSMGWDPGAWGLLLVLALVQTLGALAAYTAALKYIEAGVASIVATLEPVVATMLAYFVLREPLGWPQFVGGGLILAAILLLQAQSLSLPKGKKSVSKG